jgi:hypothetical protein
MSKKLQLQVPVPCHEDWDKMTDAEKGRFCSSCQKTVIDFSKMSDREIALFCHDRGTTHHEQSPLVKRCDRRSWHWHALHQIQLLALQQNRNRGKQVIYY